MKAAQFLREIDQHLVTGPVKLAKVLPAIAAPDR
jgi:hypothetical protein